jgi:hypothetical protein
MIIAVESKRKIEPFGQYSYSYLSRFFAPQKLCKERELRKRLTIYYYDS